MVWVPGCSFLPHRDLVVHLWASSLLGMFTSYLATVWVLASQPQAEVGTKLLPYSRTTAKTHLCPSPGVALSQMAPRTPVPTGLGGDSLFCQAWGVVVASSAGSCWDSAGGAGLGACSHANPDLTVSFIPRLPVILLPQTLRHRVQLLCPRSLALWDGQTGSASGFSGENCLNTDTQAHLYPFSG